MRGAKRRGELKADADPLLCATLLFGAIEVSITALVMGLYEVKDEKATERAAQQVADAFLRGVLPGGAAEMEWKSKQSNIKSRALRRS